MKCWMKNVINGLWLLGLLCPLVLLPASKSIKTFEQFINCLDSISNDNINPRQDHRTALHYATRNPAVLYQLLNCKEADINVKGSFGQYLNYTPLHFAVENGDYLATVLLLSYGANSSVQLKHSNLPTDIKILDLVESKIKLASKIFLRTKRVLDQFDAFKNSSSWIGDGTPRASGAEICDAFLNYLADGYLVYPTDQRINEVITILSEFLHRIDVSDKKLVRRAIDNSYLSLLLFCFAHSLGENKSLDKYLENEEAKKNFLSKDNVNKFLKSLEYTDNQKAQIHAALSYFGGQEPEQFAYDSNVISPISVISLSDNFASKVIEKNATIINSKLAGDKTLLHLVMNSQHSDHKKLAIITQLISNPDFNKDTLAMKDRYGKIAYDYLKDNADDTLKKLLQPIPTLSPTPRLGQI